MAQEPTMPTEGELVDFPHGAAGHQGISSNAAGDLIIKPCVQAEIDFYEAAKDHPMFQAHMPVYMGKLELGNKTTPIIAGNTSSAMAGTHTREEASNSNPAKRENVEVAEAKEAKATKAWVPSGGKKLDTGLAIVLENSTAHFVKPNVMDLKLGARLWDDDAPEAKRQKLDQVAAETTSGSLGFRIAGAKIWVGEQTEECKEDEKKKVEANTEIKEGYKSYNKNYGRSLNEETVQTAIARFLSGKNEPTVKGRTKSWLSTDEAKVIAEKLIRELESIEYVLEHEESRMYSASILIVIEGDETALQTAMAAEEELKGQDEEKDTSDGKGKEEVGIVVQEGEEVVDESDDDEQESVVGPKTMEVRLIDFAHARFTPGQGKDENALKGVRSIIAILKDICV